ncbi:MAG TPA: hypothetical protein VMY88_03385 [Acidimicrobiales bacterium]|nr:hypothetical protein [Acidimicrobiales bacterium]
MARGVAPDGTAIYLYKHYFTRHHLNLDADGNAYSYVGGASDDDDVTDHYVPLPDLETGLDALDLWELPWMKEGLEIHRRGLSWDERWKLHPDNEHAGDLGGESRGHLRLV